VLHSRSSKSPDQILIGQRHIARIALLSWAGNRLPNAGTQNSKRRASMAPRQLTDFLVVGAGAAGLMTARELARAGKRVTILEARNRCGGRIDPLPVDQFGYPAEGGAEFVH